MKPEIIWEAAEISEYSGRIEEAANYWKLYLASDPEYLPYHEKLAEYYLSEGGREKGLSHLDILIEKDVKRDRYLLVAADIYLYEIGRIDRALNYYEWYQREFPEGRDVAGDIANLRIIMANDLLSIVENSGVWMLWRDLAVVTPERSAIYRVMADMLEELGRTRELIETLQIIIVHEPGDAETRVRLATLLRERKDFEGCLAYLDDSNIQGVLPDSFLILRAGCGEALGNEISSLQDYREFFEI